MIPVNNSTGFSEGVSHPHPESRPSDLRQDFLDKDFRLLDRYELQTEWVGALRQTEHHSHLVPKCAACHRSFRHKRCDRNHDWAEAQNSCGARLCPHCSRRRALILAGRVEAFSLGRPGLRYAVLSERNTSDLAEGTALLWESWTRLRRSVRWKRRVRGSMVVMEVTYNAEEQTWHPHLNLLMEGEYFPRKELRQMWIKATQYRGEIVHIKAADAGTVRELIKYCCKLADLVENPAALDEFLTAVKGKRLVRTYGTFHEILVEDEDNPGMSECPDCGPDVHPCVVDLGYVDPWQVSLDFNGTLRVDRSTREVDRAMKKATDFRREFLPVYVEPPAAESKPATEAPISGRSLLRHWDRLHGEYAAAHRIPSDIWADQPGSEAGL